MTPRTTRHRLISLRDRLKQHALHVGRYDAPHTPAAYDARDKSRAFRCIAYQVTIRDVTAIEVALKIIEQEYGK